MAAGLAVFWHDAVLEHDTGAGVWEAARSDLVEVAELHPENAERLCNMRRILERGPLADGLEWQDGRLADEREVETVHDPAYVAELRQTCAAGGRRFGSTTVLSATSWDALLAAAGTTLSAASFVLETDDMAYALVRPPGHHLRANCCTISTAGIALSRLSSPMVASSPSCVGN